MPSVAVKPKPKSSSSNLKRPVVPNLEDYDSSNQDQANGESFDTSDEVLTRTSSSGERPSESDQITPPSSGLPKPLFQEEVLSTKKERGTPKFKRPPRPPAKTCPPVSRVFKRRPDFLEPSARALSFLQSPDGSLTGTPLESDGVYDKTKPDTYFEQTFMVDQVIGAGYFGTVVRAKHKETGHLYAIKIAKEKYKGNSDRERKLEEVRKHQVLLPHPNCVHFYQSWEEYGRLYQQFELCESSLADISEKMHELPEEQVWSYLVDLLLALSHLHDHNLIHMDVKPENIFIGRDGLCKLGDFGLMIDLTKDTETVALGAVAGDAKYMASELLHQRYTKAADIFSLGITILELSCDLDLPSGGPLWHQLRTTGPDPTLTAKLSPDLRRVIQMMMGQDPERRPTAKQLLGLPAVERAKKRREGQLLARKIVNVAKSIVHPIFHLFYLVFVFFFVTPFRRAYDKICLWFTKPKSNEVTPVSKDKVTWADDAGIRFQQNIALFSSDEDDLENSRSSGTSILASPLPHDSDWPSPIRSPHHFPMGPRRPMEIQSTPSGLRLRSRVTAFKNGLSPNKRLDFDDVYGRSPEKTADTSSFLENDSDTDSDVSNKVKPVKLASKFDYFSDDD